MKDDTPSHTVKQPESPLFDQPTEELRTAARLIEETGANLFLTGKAGTGKSTFIRRLAEYSHKRMVLLAPTGVAAVNVGGMTIHSLFQFPFSPYIPGKGFIHEEKKFFRFNRNKLNLIRSLDLIVIDEISMVRPDLLDALDETLRRLRASDLPFGGVQLLLTGDLRQLAPVVKSDEWNLLSPHYPSAYFFESHALRSAGFVTIELTSVFRQDDERFIALLNNIREGRADAGTMQALNSRLIRLAPEENSGYIRLTTHNWLADNINVHELSSLPGSEMRFDARIDGDFPENAFPNERSLTLKIGAQVMFIKNDTGESRRFFNGKIGTVAGFGHNTVYVDMHDGGELAEVAFTEWDNVHYEVDAESSEIRSVKDGTFAQIPLRLAWAITIHKSQGLTFDKAIIDASRAFAPGQVYVALSRCRSLEGLVLESRLTPASVMTDSVVSEFIAGASRSIPDAQAIRRMRGEYFTMMLGELFALRPLWLAFADLNRVVNSYVVPLHPELWNSYNEAGGILSGLRDVASRFLSLYAAAPVEDADAVAPALLQKISGGCAYFLERLEKIRALLSPTPDTLDNARYRKMLRNSLDRWNKTLALKIELMKAFASAPFSPRSYLEVKDRAASVLENAGTVTGSRQTKSRKKDKAVRKEKMPKREKREKGYSAHATLELLNEGLDVCAIAARRNLTESTVIGHIAFLITRGFFCAEQIMSPEMIETGHRVIGEAAPDTPYTDILQKALAAGMSRQEFSLIYKLRRERMRQLDEYLKSGATGPAADF